MLATFALLLSGNALPVPLTPKNMEERRAQRAAHKAIVTTILSAVRSRNAAAFRKTGAAGAPYLLDLPGPVGPRPDPRPSASPFTIDSLAPLASCVHEAPSLASGNWIRVQWNCPASIGRPWSNVATAFLFDGGKVIRVETRPGLPTITRREPAKPIDRGSWITADDYPREAKNLGLEGNVGINLTVSPQGTVADCKILASSGHPILDEGTCALLRNKAHFTPAQDQSGKPITSQYQMGAVWRLPE